MVILLSFAIFGDPGTGDSGSSTLVGSVSSGPWILLCPDPKARKLAKDCKEFCCCQLTLMAGAEAKEDTRDTNLYIQFVARL